MKHADPIAAHELALYTINHSDLYRRQTEPILKNLRRKIARGVYDPNKALKLWGYLAESGAKEYAKEFGGTWHKLFSVPTRNEAAKEIARHYGDDIPEFDMTNRRYAFGELPVRKNPTPRRVIGYYVMTRRGGKPGSVAWVRTEAEGKKEVALDPYNRYLEPGYEAVRPRDPTEKGMIKKNPQGRGPYAYGNIERKRDGSYIGHATGVWRIYKGDGGWRAHPTANVGDADGNYQSLFGRTLGEISQKLYAFNEHYAKWKKDWSPGGKPYEFWKMQKLENKDTEMKRNPHKRCNPRWQYEDARGVEKTGEFIRAIEGQGTDVTYVFKSDDGSTDMVSGSRLKKATRLYNNPHKRSSKKPLSPKQAAWRKKFAKLVKSGAFRKGKLKSNPKIRKHSRRKIRVAIKRGLRGTGVAPVTRRMILKASRRVQRNPHKKTSPRINTSDFLVVVEVSPRSIEFYSHMDATGIHTTKNILDAARYQRRGTPNDLCRFIAFKTGKRCTVANGQTTMAQLKTAFGH